MQYSSKLIENAVDYISTLPGIGRKTAFRLVLHLLKKDEDFVFHFADSLKLLKTDILNCSNCGNYADEEICAICADESRSKDIICVVEDIRDVIAIENTTYFKGKYHILGGIISPVNGVGPSDLNIASLLKKVEEGTIKEIIMALPATIDGDTTNFFIYKKLKPFNLKITIIARGVAIGNDLEYTDEITLGKSIQNRIPFENTFHN
jgi:recombination protein RecR